MNYNDFMVVDTKGKMNFLLEYWQLDKPILFGTVKKKEELHIIIDDICAINGAKMINPFSQKGTMSVYCAIDDTVEISVGDKVCFKFSINPEKEKLRISPIIIFKKNILRLNYIDDKNFNYYDQILEFLKENNIDTQADEELIEEEIADKLELLLSVCAHKEIELLREKTATDLDEITVNLENKRLEYDKMLLKHKNTMAAIKKRDSEYKKIQSRIIEAEDVIKEKDNEFIEIQSRINKADEDLKKKAEELKEKDKIKKRFEDFGFEFEDDETADSVTGVTDIEKENYIDYIQSYLASREEKKLFYKKEILEQFYAGL